MLVQRRWQRIILLIVLGYEGLGALAGGGLLVAGPDGHFMDIPIGVLHGAFRDFLIPGVILLGLGLLNVAAFAAVLRKFRADWIMAGLATVGMAIWFIVEILIVREVVWLHAMWGFPVIVGLLAALPLVPAGPAAMRDLLLASGVVSSLLYIAMNVLVPTQWPDYHSASQVVSELSAIGAPTRPLWVMLGMLYTLLVVAFGWGVWTAADGNRRLRVAGILIAAYGALGFLWPFAPMHQREVIASGGGTLADQMHLALGGLTEVIYLVALGFAAAALGRPFRAYSLATLAVLFVFGVLLFRDAPAVGANQPTPLIGVWERINIGVFLLWMIVLALVLLARDRQKLPRNRASWARYRSAEARNASPA